MRGAVEAPVVGLAVGERLTGYPLGVRSLVACPHRAPELALELQRCAGFLAHHARRPDEVAARLAGAVAAPADRRGLLLLEAVAERLLQVADEALRLVDALDHHGPGRLGVDAFAPCEIGRAHV